MNIFRAGIDIGSTTVKLVLLDEENRVVWQEYRRHQAHTQETLADLLQEAGEKVGGGALRAAITGSGERTVSFSQVKDIPVRLKVTD